MNLKRLIKRREFLKLSSASLVAGLTTRLNGEPWTGREVTIEEAARIVGELPHWKLGYSGR